MPPNFGCALMLARWRHAAGSLRRAAFLSARNDTIANVASVPGEPIDRGLEFAIGQAHALVPRDHGLPLPR